MVGLSAFFKRIALKIKPPKVGDVYYGDSLRFIIAKPVEEILHGLRDRNGNLIWQPIPSLDCYRLTITSQIGNHYTCDSEVLCRRVSDYPGMGEWMMRTQPKVISNHYFLTLITNDYIKKAK